MVKTGFKIGMALIAGFIAFQPAMAATTIVSLNIFHQDSQGICADTNATAFCSPIGVTQAGSLANPFLNNLSNKTVNLAEGSYYLFANPDAGTNYMTQGNTVTLFLQLSTNVLLVKNAIVPDLSVAGTTIFSDSFNNISITTTGITNADRMGFGGPAVAFAGDGRPDYALLLRYGVVAPAVPEPSTWAMMLGGVALTGYALRRRRMVEARA